MNKLNSHLKNNLPNNRTFGGFFSAIFLLLTIYQYKIFNLKAAMVCAACFFLVFLPTLVSPKILAPANYLWFRLGILLGAVARPMVLGAIFFLIFTPIAAILRFSGRDNFHLKRVYVDTYWQDRLEVFNCESFKNQY